MSCCCVRDYIDASPESQGTSLERHDTAHVAIFSLQSCEVDFFVGLHEDFEGCCARQAR
jgi:hypothetical protein